ncbi:MAG: chloride channel protein, partial [Gordonia polyisoprenivorans]|nr:chloride channel protein [Gordonia polyisoprenivorans]
VLGTGYGWIQDALSRQQLLTIPLWIVIVLPLAKIVATSLSIGTGGSGGVFGPGMIVGAFAGAAIWRLSNLVGFGATHSPAPYVIVAMMACFGAISRAPLAMMLMVAEMTGTVTMLAPAMISVGLAYLIVRHWDATIYRHQLRDRDERASARLTEQLPLLDRIPVRAAMTPPMIVLDADESSVDATKLLNRVGLTGAPVVDGQGRFVGAFNVHDIGGPTAGSTADPTAASVQDTVTLEAAAAALPASTGYLPILDQDKRIVGALTLNDVARAYHAASAADDAHRARDTDRPSIHEIKVEVGDDLHGSAVSETARYGLLVLSVRRGRTHRKVKDDFVLQEHDVLTVLSDEAFAKMKALKGDDVPGREQPGLRQFRVPGR